MDQLTSLQLYKSFQDPTSRIFLEKNSDRLYRAAKEDSNLFPVTRAEIDQFKRSVEAISRSFESRTLKARRRHLQYRKWITFGPLNVLLGKYTVSLIYATPLPPGQTLQFEMKHFLHFTS